MGDLLGDQDCAGVRVRGKDDGFLGSEVDEGLTAITSPQVHECEDYVD